MGFPGLDPVLIDKSLRPREGRYNDCSGLGHGLATVVVGTEA